MLYELRKNTTTRWADFENPNAEKGQAAQMNGGAKGHAFDAIAPGQSVDLLKISGCGVVRRIWITLSNRSPYILRSLVLRMYWDGREKPAVECPLGDFFCFSTGEMSAYESELSSSPEGRSFNCFIPMPFLKSAHILIENQSNQMIKRLFYDVDFTIEPLNSDKIMYFHAWWNRQNRTVLTKDYEAIPEFDGPGRFLGMSVGVLANEVYENTWFGEGEIKMYLDDDLGPTIAGTGIEDYIGTAWGQGQFANRTQGCLSADVQNRKWSFYRWHTVDPVWFSKNLTVRIQQIGGAKSDVIKRLQAKSAPMIIVSADGEQGFDRLYNQKEHFVLTNESAYSDDTWFNFYREDDYSSTAFLYSIYPENKLPPILPIEERVVGFEYRDAQN